MSLASAHAALKGKVAIVVGGAAGHLGRAATLALAEAGCRLFVCDNDREGLAAIVPAAQALGAEITALYADVEDPASLDAFYDAAETRLNHADILVNMPGGVRRNARQSVVKSPRANPHPSPMSPTTDGGVSGS